MIRSCDQLDWLVLTKRPELIKEMLPADWGRGYPNVWLGVTVEEQRWLTRVDTLSRIPAALRFVSAEPLLKPLRFGRRIKNLDGVVTGCERAANTKRRSMELGWGRDIQHECEEASIPLFHKQYYQGSKLTFDGLIDGVVRQEWPNSYCR